MGIDAEMFIRTKETISDESLIERAWRMCATFGWDKFWVNPDNGRRALMFVDQWEQDGPTLQPSNGETFIKVSLCTRYWGPGYERGNLSLLITLAEWWERVFPSSEVWYGGDSSGVCAAHFDKDMRSQFLDHAASKDGFAYRLGFDLNGERPQVCAFCGNAPMSTCRWGKGGTGSVCLGCGLHRLVSGHEVTEAIGQWPDEQKRRKEEKGAQS